MARVKCGVPSRARRKKVIKLAKGYRGRAKNCYRVATQYVDRARQYAYRDRRNRKRDMRSLWICRINAAVRVFGIPYSVFMGLLEKSDFSLDRKSLAELAVRNPSAFENLVKQLKPDV